ncbi:MAG: ATP-binding protein [Candidatus Bathyarchaeota archaeon]|nr:ATP-binding protein [Candidatus Bathyarchaeota archaeon]
MVKFGELTNQNPWWKYGKGFQRFDKDLAALHEQTIQIKREWIELKQGDIGVIRGCRQIGKTTYLKTMVNRLISQNIEPRRIMYLSIDRLIKSRRELRNALDIFLKRNMDADQVYILLDEITALKDWSLELKTISDSGITQKAKLIVTGSSGAALRNTSEQLPGRGLEGNEYYMKPLSFREFTLQTIDLFTSIPSSNQLRRALTLLKEALSTATINLTDGIDKLVETCDSILPFQEELMYLFGHYMRCGGFPVSINSYLKPLTQGNTCLIEPHHAETFVRMTLGELSKYGKNEVTARQLLDQILTKYGTTLSFRNLSTEVNHVTTIDYLDILEKSFIIHTLYAIDLNKKTPKYKGKKKIYFQDPFIHYSLKSWLSGMDVNDVTSEIMDDERLLSEIVEAMVTSHIAMSTEIPYLKEKNTFTWFYYDNSGREIDNIIKSGNSYNGVEVKYRNNVSPKDVTRALGLREYLILSKDDFSVTRDTCVIPVSVYLSLLEHSSNNL